MYIKQNGIKIPNIPGHEYFESSSNFKSAEYFTAAPSSPVHHKKIMYLLLVLGILCLIGAGVMYYKQMKQSPPHPSNSVKKSRR